MKGIVVNYDGEHLFITAPFTDTGLFVKRNVTSCEIILDDGRAISAEQRKFIYATIKDIAIYTGYLPDEAKAIMKYEYIERTGAAEFSLADCTMTQANEFIEFLIEWRVEHDIASDDLISRSPDISKYLYACLYFKKCCICGKKADLHHVDTVGMGRNRKDILHVGMRAESLCSGRYGHHMECEHIGQHRFDEKYHVYGITLDETLCKIYKLKAGVTHI